MRTYVLDGEATLLSVMDGESNLQTVIDGEIGTITRVREALPAYDGPTEVTPSAETQILPTTERSVLADIVIKPIPSNYGLITWNGSTITVS